MLFSEVFSNWEDVTVKRGQGAGITPKELGDSWEGLGSS